LVTELKRRPYGGTTATGTDSFTWVQDGAGRWYIGTSTTVTGTFTKKTAQTLDRYGNVVATNVYKPDDLSSVLRTYTNVYVTDANYTSRYIRNRLLTSTVVEGTKQAVLASNGYDQYGTWSSCWPLFSYAIGVTPVTGLRQHDAAYDANFRYRGNVTTAAGPGVCASFSVDMAGNRTGTWTKRVASTAQYQAGTNYAAPGVLTVNGLSNEMQWNAALNLTQSTGANGEVSGTVYDTYGRPSSSTAATGASTGYSYSTAAPWTVTATVNGRWTKKTLDGFGRVVKVESGHGGTTVSVTETEFDACACSATGKVKRVSMPRAPGGTAVWTNYTYDELGRTTRVTNPDNTYKEYEYVANTVKVWDEARKWKKYWMDVFGNLVQVEEPKPAADTKQAGNYFTSYTYDVLGHLIEVKMVRGDNEPHKATQVRTFNYEYEANRPGTLLLSVQNPESGTVAYTYHPDGRMATKVDAKGQKTELVYDSYKRVTQVKKYPSVGAPEDEAARVELSYDTNPYEAGYSLYAAGRLTARQYKVNGLTFTEMYSYTRPGQVAKKKLRVGKYFEQPYPYPYGALEGRWEYNAEGKMTKVTYPTAAGGGGQSYVYGYDTMGRLKTMGPQEAQTSVVSDVTYGPAGEMLTMTGVVNESRGYNSRLQLTSFNGVSYGYGASNNGRIASETVSGETVVYQYDELNRLIKAETQGDVWGREFTYDGFGNLTNKQVTKGSAPSMSVPVDGATNRAHGYAYDANGNQLWTNTQTLSYDYDNRIAWVDNRNFTGRMYGYDPDNRRVYEARWDLVNGTAVYSQHVVHFWGVTGQRLASYGFALDAGQPPYYGPSVTLTLTSDRVYFGGRLLKGELGWTGEDRLGSVGQFYPYGEARVGDPKRFATYERDGVGWIMR
jgi:YD repeat-containing protein